MYRSNGDGGEGGRGVLYTLPLVQICAYTSVFSPPTVLPSEKISAGMYRSNGDRRGEYSIHYITLDSMCVHQCVQPSYSSTQ